MTAARIAHLGLGGGSVQVGEQAAQQALARLPGAEGVLVVGQQKGQVLV